MSFAWPIADLGHRLSCRFGPVGKASEVRTSKKSVALHVDSEVRSVWAQLSSSKVAVGVARVIAVRK